MTTPLRSVREHMDDHRLDRVQGERDKLARAVAALPFLESTIIKGLEQSDGSITDGIEFTAGQTRELPHGLHGKCEGFLVIDVQTAAEGLRRVAATSGLEKTHIRLTNGGAATTKVKLLVWR